MVIKHTEETTEAWKFCVMVQNVQHYGRQKRTTIRDSKFIPTPFWRPRMGISLPFTKNVLDFVLAMWKNGLLITSWTIQTHSLYEEWLIMSMKHMTIRSTAWTAD
jgi:hypothetical protein